MSGRAPLEVKLNSVVPAVTIAADDITVIGTAPFAGTVSAVVYVPEVDITGADTNSRTFNLHNRGQAGAGTTVVASLAMVSGVNAADYDEEAITLSIVADATDVAAGDVLTWQSLHIGDGIADPGGSVFVTIDRE